MAEQDTRKLSEEELQELVAASDSGARSPTGSHAVAEPAALLEDGVLTDLFIDSSAPRPGTLYRARAVRRAWY